MPWTTWRCASVPPTFTSPPARGKLFRHFGLFNDKLQLTMPKVVVKDLTGRKD